MGVIVNNVFELNETFNDKVKAMVMVEGIFTCQVLPMWDPTKKSILIQTSKTAADLCSTVSSSLGVDIKDVTAECLPA